jgi:hypothetical protein
MSLRFGKATCAIWIALAVRLWSQVATGTITGVVKDSTGAVILAANVTVTEQQTGTAVSVKSQHDGAYTVPNLSPADYRVVAEVAGFKRLVIDGLKVDVGSILTQDLVLEVGGTTESIQVSGHTSLVETTNGEVGTTVQVSHVLEMPLVDRNVFNLVNLVPGSFSSAGLVSIGGGRLQTAQALVDGVNNTRGGLGANGIELSPPVEAMQEFKVEVNSFGAEFGHTNGGVVNAVTRSGTNKFHGNVYEFLRNDKLDAAGWGVDALPPLRRNNFGGTIGGPIRKNKTFFFYNLDYLLQHDGVSTTRNVGLPAWRTGDFSTATRDAGGRAAPVVIYDPSTGTGTFATPINTTPFPNNIIPTSRLDPVAVKAMTYLPAPNRTPNDPFNNTGNWQENTINTTTRAYHTIRIDHELTDATKFFFRYILTQPEDNLTGYSKGYGVADPAGLFIHNRRQNLAVNMTHLFSPTRFVNFTAGVNRVYIDRKSGNCCATNYGKLFGLPNVPGEAFPLFNFGGGLVPVAAIGAAGNANRIASFTNWDYIANFTDIRGKHTLKYGGQYSRFGANDHSRPSPGGTWVSNGQYTRGITASGAAVANTGANLADFLLGRLSSITASVSPSIGRRFQEYGAYIQDDWRITPRLTLNIGLRYDTENPAYEVDGRMNNFNPWAPNPLAGTGDIPAGAIGVVTFPNLNGQGKYLWNWNKLNFAPRFGFAWRPFGTNDTVVRGGFGIFFGDSYDREIIQELRLGFGTTYTARIPVPTVLKDGLPAGALDDVPVSQLTPSFGVRGTPFETSQIQYLDPNRKTPYNINFNLTIQHQWKGVLFEIGGLGNLGRQAIFGNINVNHIPADLLAQTSIPSRLRRPWTAYGSDATQIQILGPNWGLSNYLGFTFKSERRYQNGLGWVVAYSFTRWIDNLISQGTPLGDNTQVQDIYNLKAERSLSTNDAPHRLVLSPIYDLPFGKGRHWLQHGILSQIVGGWQIAMIGTLQSGSPFGTTVLNGTTNLLGDNSDGTVLRTDLVPGQPLYAADKGSPAAGVRGLDWLNPAAFADPAAFTYGNSSRTLPKVLGPGMINFDSLLAKNFRVGERWRAQFRWEMFNLTNTPNWGAVNESLGGTSFGVITTATSRRIMQLGLKLYW